MTPTGGSYSQYNACVKVAHTEFAQECGLCDPKTCDPAPTKSPESGPLPTSPPNTQMCGVETCTQIVLESTACAVKCYTCGDRIDYLINEGSSESEACLYVGNEFPSICGPCIPEGLTNVPTPSSK